MHAFMIKLFKTFMTSFTIYISRKLIYFLEDYFSNKLMQDIVMITCSSCGESFNKEIIYTLYHKTCPYCLSKFQCDFFEHESNNGTFRRGYDLNPHYKSNKKIAIDHN